MREISFVKKLKFNFTGSVAKRALVIGDADNDEHNELICANLQGDLSIFKARNPNRYAYATDLGMVTACLVGDIINNGKNSVAVINTEGWLFIFDVTNSCRTHKEPSNECDTSSSGVATVDSNSNPQRVEYPCGIRLNHQYSQQLPANCKEFLLADLDGDGQNEVIVGLTDRVLRTYKWIRIGPNGGKFVGLYKWEFADQIGSVSLNPSRHENCQDIIVAQPGGTYAKLECFNKRSIASSSPISSSSKNLEPQRVSQPEILNRENIVKTEFISKLTPEYHQLALAQMRNHHVSTEVLGGIKNGKDSDNFSLIAIATLDGTLMLVNKDDILWSLQVDHQLFALSVLESETNSTRQTADSEPVDTATFDVKTEDSCMLKKESRNTETQQYFVACAWNGKTYIIDEERNYLRFKYDEAVSAFTAGNYYFDGTHHSSLVYATFHNQIVLFFDITQNKIRPMYLLDELMSNPQHEEILKKLDRLSFRLEKKEDNKTNSENRTERLYRSLQEVLYGLTDNELKQA